MSNHKAINSVSGLEMLDKVREICIKYPEVTESVDKFGHTSFRVKDKPFVIMGENESMDEATSLSINTLPTTQEILLQQEGYYKTPYIGQHGWTSFRTSTLNWKEVDAMIKDAYVRTAPKRLAKEY